MLLRSGRPRVYPLPRIASLDEAISSLGVLFAPQHRTIDDALASYERTMLERVRGAIAEATADHLIAATGPGPLLADYGGRSNLGTPKAL
jgi:hypothetical protein